MVNLIKFYLLMEWIRFLFHCR